MAVTSGSVVSSAYSNRSITLNWQIAEQNQAGRWTDINWQLVGSGSAGGYYTSGNFKVIIDGVQVFFSATRIPLYNGTAIASGVTRIYHDTLGKKTFPVYIEAGIYTVAVNVSGSGSFELPDIPVGIVKVGLDGVFKDCLVYVGIDGVYKQCEVYIGKDGTYKQCV